MSAPLSLDPPRFDLTADLGDGVTLLEASAGTGKTHTIASVAVRRLAEGVPVEQLLVVTFTRLATGELRSRVRGRLLDVEAGLRAAEGGAAPDDELVTFLATGPTAEVARRRDNLARALADFDAATITTIHGFCEQVLVELGTAADGGRDQQFVEDLQDTVTEVVDDFYLRKFLRSERPAFSRKVAEEIVWKAVANRDARIVPVPGNQGTAATRASLADNARREVAARTLRAGLLSWDDQLTRLCATLHGPTAEAAIARLRRRYRVVLVDEFQDTDPLQWDIFQTAFAGPGRSLFLIGDPKQAIYSFRGADVFTYLRAARHADQRRTLDTNWRSDQPLLDAIDAVIWGADLGHPEIPYREVHAREGHGTSGLEGMPAGAPMRLRLVHRGDGRVVTTAKTGVAQADRARELVADDLAADVVGVLTSAATRRTDDGRRPIEPADLAVLVRTNQEAEVVRQALADRDVPAVIVGGGSVYASPAARSWVTLLEALEQPSAVGRARAGALTPFIGWDLVDLDGAGDVALEDLQARLHHWAGILTTAGVAALWAAMVAETGLVHRELARVGGERRLTDLRHIGELLHADALVLGNGVRALTAELRERMERPGGEGGADDRSRRLESDAAAVQILTVHRSKGLEFPIVYLPYLWGASVDRDDLPAFHDPEQGEGRTIDVGGEGWQHYAEHRDRAAEERRGEDLRQAYVALTRAKHQLVIWWVSGHSTDRSSLARLLLEAPPGRDLNRHPVKVPGHDDDIEARLEVVAGRARTSDCIAVERVGPGRPDRWEPPSDPPDTLTVDRFERDLDTSWRRASYTAITADAHGADPVVSSEAERPGVTDEAPEPGPGDAAGWADPPPPGEPAAATPSPMAGLPAGATFGILVHAVLEDADFTAPDLRSELARHVDRVAGRPGGAGDLDRVALAAGLEAVVRSPLGPLAGDRALVDLGRGDRLDELAFELPLVGGDVPHGQLSVAAIAAALGRWLPADDPLAAYPARLAGAGLAADLRGYLTGSLDLVARIHTATGPRHLVIDYKTNRLAAADQALTAWHYRPARLAEAMMVEHYPLQAILYTVALHRYLRWRQPGYEPEQHLGGVLYLFVRGMTGPATPVVGPGPCGVFAWSPPAGLVVELSDHFDEGDRR